MAERNATFAELLNHHMETLQWGLDRLANASDIPKPTLAGWRRQGKSPREWQSVVKLAAAMGLDKQQTNELLQAARGTSLEKLRASSLKEKDRLLLSQWTIEAEVGEVAPQENALLLAEQDAEPEAWFRKNKRILFIVSIVLASIALLAFWQTRMLPLFSPQPSLTTMNAAPAGAIRLVEQTIGTQMQLELADSQVITIGGAIQVGERVTISFVIRNDHSAPVSIQQLRAGGRMSHSCSESNTTKWSGLPVEFPAVKNLVLQPGEEYRYQSSRHYSSAGFYFMEPVRQGDDGRWGGFSPSACIDLLVTR